MPRIVIENLDEKAIETTELSKPLLRHFHDNGIDWLHACGARGRCTTCKVIILSGAANLTPLTAAEERYRSLGALPEGTRLSCQVNVTGDIRVAVPADGKLPHIRYSDDPANH